MTPKMMTPTTTTTTTTFRNELATYPLATKNRQMTRLGETQTKPSTNLCLILALHPSSRTTTTQSHPRSLNQQITTTNRHRCQRRSLNQMIQI